MKKAGIWAAVFALLFVVQSSLLPRIGYMGISPDLMLLVTVSFAFLRGSRYGVFVGFMVGLMQDLATGTFFGVDIFAKMVIGYTAGVFSNQVFKEQMLLPLLAGVAATVGQYLIILGFMFMLGYRTEWLTNPGLVLIPMVFYNFIFSLPVHRLLYSLCERLDSKEGSRRAE